MALFWIIFGSVFSASMIGAGIALAVVQRKRAAETLRRVRRGVGAEPTPTVVRSMLQNRPERTGPKLMTLQRQITVAGLDWDARLMALAMAGLGSAGACAGWFWHVLLYPGASAIALAIAVASLPYMYVSRKAKKRLNAFEAGFPDALEFFARAIRAGHALSVGLEMVSTECQQPLRGEFRRIHTEQNLGSPLDVALRGFADRVPLVDVRFFVSAVLLQRETGGNLSEILDNLSGVIRDRFQLKAKVRAASSHGRMTAMALSIIPIGLIGLLSLVSPGYLQRLTADPDGRLMLLGSALGQALAYVCMKKITNIKV